ncbi:hypothetical protein H1R17_03970 [Flavobacterium sp. xlx-214]|uniref:hypothetical protein n=1 Tax=unclassified Flavobacterium TaxID=196869 RepID=UPI0013D8A279|nr:MULTISPECIES: hypothetical protein [unclassified Flavobacterium]MBA5792049.1 hypothetical protein [Flavobacterium sp. xlx-221]QMI84299.1 hypothetical protein H1R17_03970 [Flavobacterium sp. xlx-214]
MKNVVYIILFIASSAMYGQQNMSIVNDPLYLKYEAAYVEHSRNVASTLKDLDVMEQEFYGKFNNIKDLEKFNKNKDKEKWLSRNIGKTSFKDAGEATSIYNNIVKLNNYKEDASKSLTDMINELTKNYSGVEISKVLRSRISK